MLNQIFKNVYMRLDEKAVTMAQPQKMWSGILGPWAVPSFFSLVGWLVSGAPTFVFSTTGIVFNYKSFVGVNI